MYSNVVFHGYCEVILSFEKHYVVETETNTKVTVPVIILLLRFVNQSGSVQSSCFHN